MKHNARTRSYNVSYNVCRYTSNVLKSGFLGVNRKHHPQRNLGLTITRGKKKKMSFQCSKPFCHIFLVVIIHKERCLGRWSQWNSLLETDDVSFSLYSLTNIYQIWLGWITFWSFFSIQKSFYSFSMKQIHSKPESTLADGSLLNLEYSTNGTFLRVKYKPVVSQDFGSLAWWHRSRSACNFSRLMPRLVMEPSFFS